MQGQPIPFIEIDDTERDGEVTNNFVVNPEAIKMLLQQADKRIAVLVIAGPQRTGKSFLANRVLKRQNGFAIGPTTNPCTKGIWIWNQPVPLDANTNLIILDTEGLHSVQRDINIDIKIFSISVLLSSMFVFNQLGHIDEQSIENLSLVVNLSENIQVGPGQDNKNLSAYFPNFLWILRDFSLDLKGRSSNEYLEYALSNQPGNAPEILRKNGIRAKVREYFKQRECLCLIRPLNDEKLLARIEEQDYNSLRPEFLQGVQQFEQKVAKIQPKCINGTYLTGEMFIKLTLEYIDAINSGGIPQILTSLDRVVQQEARKVLEDMKKLFQSRIIELLNEKGEGPYEEEDIQQTFRMTQKTIYEKLDQRGKDLVDPTRIITMKKEMQDLMDRDLQLKLDYNREKGAVVCNKLVGQFINSFQLPVLDGVESVKETLVQEKLAEFGRFYAYYVKNAKTTFKYRLISDRIPPFLFGFFEKLLQSVQRVFIEDHNNTKKYLVQAREGEERLRNTLKEYESLLYENQKEIDILKYEFKNKDRELEKVQKIKELNIQSLSHEVEKLQQQLKQKKDKNSRLKTENQNLIEEMQRSRNELNSKKIECNTLVRRLQEESGRGGSFLQGDKIEDITNDLMVQYKDMKHQAAMINEFFKRRALDQSSQNIFMQEIHKMQTDRFNEIQRIKEDYKQKRLKLREDLEKEKKALKASLEHIVRQNEELKAQNLTFFEKAENLERKDQQIKSLLQENQKLNQVVQHKNSNLETHLQVIENFTKDIMKLTSQKEDLEQKLAFLNSEKSNLVSFKESFPYILKESLKWVLNKNSKLKHAIKSIGEEDQVAIRECFQEVGIHI